jgi:hypothetical protein
MNPTLMNEYLEFCEFRRTALTSGILDLRNLKWVYPTTLLPLGSMIRGAGKKLEYKPPEKEDVRGYIDHMVQMKSIAYSPGRSYIPIALLPRNGINANEVVKPIFKFHSNGEKYGGEGAFKYFIWELVNNIYEHSEFTESMVMAQRYEKKGFVEIAFLDNGITINGSLKKAGKGLDEDFDAISRAMEGLSAKKDQGRGYGLWSTTRLCIEGLGGNMLIVSGAGAVYYGEARQLRKKYKLSQEYLRLEGTLISLMIPYPAKKVEVNEYVS